MRTSIAVFLVALVHSTCAWSATAADALSRAAGGDHFILIRHAIAPGAGDPQSVRLGDCATQRNLSQAGREQAARIGARLRGSGIASARVYSSRWCRAAETARLLGLGPVTELPALDSFFSQGDGPAQTRALRKWIAEQDLTTPIVLVTHQVNITAISGVHAASGEMVVMRRRADGALSRAGTVRVD